MPYPSGSEQGFVTFANLLLQGGEFTLSPGATPSTGLLYMYPTTLPVTTGDVVFSWEGTTITLAQCALDFTSLRQVRTSMGWRWKMKFEDRRWKWRYAEISAQYNQRDSEGYLIGFEELSAQGIATTLLEALGESNYDVSGLPDANPYGFYVDRNPSLALSELCDRYSCSIILRLDNTIAIVKDGIGAALPTADAIQPPTWYWNYSALPSDLKVVGSPTIYQSKFELIPVGLDTDDVVKPIDDLSYIPTNGWGPENPDYFSNVSAANRDLALRTVWRWYQVKQFAGVGLTLPGEVTLNTISDALPLHSDEYIQTAFLSPVTSAYHPKRAYITGEYWDRGLIGENTNELYAGDFTLDVNRGIVMFAEPVMKIDGSKNNIAAPIYLWASHYIDNGEGAPITYSKTKSLGGTNGTELLQHMPLRRIVRSTYSGTTHTGYDFNDGEIDTEADVFLNERERFYVNGTEATEIVYNGLHAIEADGAINQVKWFTGIGRKAGTMASRNTQSDVYSKSKFARLRDEKVIFGFEKGIR